MISTIGALLFVLMFNVIVVVGFYVVQWNATILIKYVAIFVVALIITTVMYDLLVKRTNVMCFVFGMGLKKKPAQASAKTPDETAA